MEKTGERTSNRHTKVLHWESISFPSILLPNKYGKYDFSMVDMANEKGEERNREKSPLVLMTLMVRSTTSSLPSFEREWE